jgi:hypothetical protein
MKGFSLSEEFSEILSYKYIGLHVKCPLFLSDFNDIRTSADFHQKKSSNMKFHESPSSGSRVVPYGKLDRQTDSRHNDVNSRFSQFSNATKNETKQKITLCRKGDYLVAPFPEILSLAPAYLTVCTDCRIKNRIQQ